MVLFRDRTCTETQCLCFNTAFPVSRELTAKTQTLVVNVQVSCSDEFVQQWSLWSFSVPLVRENGKHLKVQLTERCATTGRKIDSFATNTISKAYRRCGIKVYLDSFAASVHKTICSAVYVHNFPEMRGTLKMHINC